MSEVAVVELVATYSYDALGRVSSKVQTVIANPVDKTFTVGYTYANGRQTGVGYPSGRVVAYGFDAAGRVASITVDGVAVLGSVGYFPFGAPSGWTWGNGEAYARSYDLDGRVTSRRHMGELRRHFRMQVRARGARAYTGKSSFIQ